MKLLEKFTGLGAKEILAIILTTVICVLLRRWQFNEERFDAMLIHATADCVFGVMVASWVYLTYMRGPKAMARMLATGYYLAFIRYIKLQIDADKVALKKGGQTFTKNQTKIICYYPAKFDDTHIKAWKQKFDLDPATKMAAAGWSQDSLAAPNHHTGEIRINYSVNGADLIIHDSMNTFMTIFYYCRDTRKLSGHHLTQIPEKTIKRFIDTIQKNLNPGGKDWAGFPIEFQPV